MKTIKDIIIAVLIMIISSCSTIHEFPDENPVDPTIINLNLALLLKLSQQEQIFEVGTKSIGQNHDVRFIIEMYENYRMGDDNEPVLRYVNTYPLTELIFPDIVNTSMRVKASQYKCLIWLDCVDAGNTADKYHITNNFPSVTLVSPYIGNNDYKYSLSGVLDLDLREYRHSKDVVINKEMDIFYTCGKLKIITTDIDKFITKVKSKSPGDVSLDDYKIKFLYQGYVPGGYNLLTGGPNADAATGFGFESTMDMLDNNEVLLGSDVIFSNGVAVYVRLVVEVWDKNNVLIHRTNISPTERGIPIEKGKITIVKGEFLTKDFVPGVGVNPDFEGEDTWYMDDNGNLIKK